MKRTLIYVLIFCSPFFANAQGDSTQKVLAPIWTFQQVNSEIYGISIGLASTPQKPKNSITQGLKLELFGLGFFLLFAPESPLSYNDSIYGMRLKMPRSEKINGIALASTGSFCDCSINGISVGGLGQYFVKINGLGLAPIMFTEQMNGIQIAGFNGIYYSRGFQGAVVFNWNEHGRNLMLASFNLSNDFKGVQIGLINKASKLKGIQIGLWNINEKRKLPFMNWSFKK